MPPTATLAILAWIVFFPMCVEAFRATRNERAQFARGGVEPRGDVYAWMRLAYPGVFAAMLVECAIRGVPNDGWLVAGLTIFTAGKALKWWAIATLGPRWTFRVVVVPGDPLIRSGPYRFVRHPNYAGVCLELVGAAVMTHAYVSGPLGVVLFGTLVLMRISVENRALHDTAPGPPRGL
jgi:methyltransferase